MARRNADPRLFYKMDIAYWDNPKLIPYIEDRLRIPVLHQRAIAYCCQHLTDGVFPIGYVARSVAATWCGSQCGSHDGSLCDVCEAAHAGLILLLGGGRAAVHDYLEHQTSADQAGKRSAAGQKAANARHGNTPDADRSADRSADRDAEEKRREEKRKTLAHEAQEAHGCADADASARENETSSEPTPLLAVEAEKPASKTRPGGRDLDAAFAAFWDSYPRKKSKAAGRAAYEKAARKVGPERIRAALESQLPVLMAKEPDFRPYPATWLNRESWEDEPDAPARSGPLVVSGPHSVDGAIVDDAGTYSGWIHPTPVVRGGVVVHDPLGALGEPVVGGDHDWWAEQGPLSASESPAGSKRGGMPTRAVRAS